MSTPTTPRGERVYGAKTVHFYPEGKTMKPDKQTFEAIIADLELTLSDEKKMFSNQNPKACDLAWNPRAYDLGWETGFEAAINQIKRRKKLFIGD